LSPPTHIFTKFKNFLTLSGEISALFYNAIKCSFSRPFYLNRLADQIKNLGVGSISITIVIGLTMGLIMTLNFGYGLKKFGGVLYVPSVVSLSLAREMAPFFTSLIIAGRIGSGIAAEIGAMNVTQQVDAIRALGTSPLRVLVVPRFWASVLSLPLLTTLSFALGILGGLIVCMSEFDMSVGFYFHKVFWTVRPEDYISGLVKSGVFGGIISILACHKALKTRDGTRGVGDTTTWVVVSSSICILITNFFISKLFLVFWGQ
jgi:phospholipid/cholesterol/gamma-HCH transport system permease protein